MEREEQVERVLTSDLDALSKVQRLVYMGMDEQDADELVERYEIGQAAPVYYERIDFDYET